MTTLLSAICFFTGNANNAAITPLGEGNINATWLLQTEKGKKFVLQRLNTDVFPNARQILSNMQMISRHILAASTNEGICSENFTVPRLCAGKNGAHFFLAQDGSFWRLINYIHHTRTLQTVSNTDQAKELGRKLGIFHRLCRSLNPETLTDTLPGFHITPHYLSACDAAVSSSKNTPVINNTMQYCLDSIESMRGIASMLEENKNILTSQVIHGDPKVSNFLFDEKSDRVISLIDLDTVKPGLLLYDIGDGLRSCCNAAGENPEHQERIIFHRAFFKAWLCGYLQEAQFLLTNHDMKRIVTATRLITFELGLRFFTDYLTGNHYFRTNYPDHNLHRAHVQFTLANSMETIHLQLEKDVDETMSALSASKQKSS